MRTSNAKCLENGEVSGSSEQEVAKIKVNVSLTVSVHHPHCSNE